MNNLIRIYKIMLRFWPYLVGAIFFMFGFALFSGASVTMAVPLFDDVFGNKQNEIIYHNYSEVISAVEDIISGELKNSIQSLNNLNTAKLTNIKEKITFITKHTDKKLLLQLISIFMICVILLKNLFYIGNRAMNINLQGKTVKAIRDDMYKKYLAQSIAFFNKNRTGDSLVRLINDVSIVSTNFIVSLLNVLRDLVLIIVYLGIAIYINYKLFIIGMLILPIFTFSITFIGKKIKKYAKKIQSQFSSLFSNVEEILSNIKIVKAFGREDYEIKQFNKLTKKYFQFWRKSEVYKSFNVPLSEINSVLIGVIVLLVGGVQVLNESSDFTFGNFTAFLFALFSVMHPFKNITKAYTEIQKALVSLNRISEIFDLKADIQDAENPITKTSFEKNIILKQVEFSYNKDKKILKDINLTINKGEKVAFVGSSGAGKTTIVNLISRMYDVTSGSIEIDGIDIRKIKISDLRKLFGTVTQESFLFTNTIKNNIKYGSLEEVSDDQIINAAKIANADEFIEKLPKKYDELLNTKGSNLSGGQKQRLCIARAIVADPPILIFDEATSALDTESERKVQDAIERATEHRTVLMIAHRLSTVLSADKIVVMDNGAIVGIGNHQELISSNDRYKYLYSLQFETK